MAFEYDENLGDCIRCRHAILEPREHGNNYRVIGCEIIKDPDDNCHFKPLEDEDA